MREIICLRPESVGKNVDEYLKQLAELAGLSIAYGDYQNGGDYHNTPTILVSDSSSLMQLIELISKRDQKIIVALNSRKDFKIVAELKSSLNSIFGFIDLSQEIDFNLPIIKNYINMHFPEGQSVFKNLANEIEKMFEFTKNELIRVKELHERLVKVRTDQFKGVTLLSKFMAGEKSGGEFFEVVQQENELCYMQIGCNSYLLTSLVLSEIEILKEDLKSSPLSALLTQLKAKVLTQAQENNSEINYCFLKINTKTLTAQLEMKGMGKLLIDCEIYQDNENGDLKLKPGQKVFLISEGAVKNWNFLNSKFTLKEFFEKNRDLVTKELVTEFFFELSRHKSGSFLIYDAFMGVLEIDQHALYQI